MQQLMDAATVLVGLLGLCDSSSLGLGLPAYFPSNSPRHLVQALHKAALEPVWGHLVILTPSSLTHPCIRTFLEHLPLPLVNSPGHAH